jgi:hypothetical protein
MWISFFPVKQRKEEQLWVLSWTQAVGFVSHGDMRAGTKQDQVQVGLRSINGDFYPITT